MKPALILSIALLLSACPGNVTSAIGPAEIVSGADLQGGLAVCVGADRELLTALESRDFRVIHVLSRDRNEVSTLRQGLQRKGRYGRITVDFLAGNRLPYADNLVNLLIDTGPGPELPAEEVLRVLRPGGVAHQNTGNGSSRTAAWTKLCKPWPDAIDEWTHYLHSSSGNPVAQDEAVHPPRQLQWVSEPEWARHHEHMASMNALVSSGGRLFSICDEGPHVSMLHPPQWKLTARDAFNGLLLWQRPIGDWFSHLHPLKNGPASLPRRLVADGDQVYATLGIQAPVSVLDARTGKTLRTCRGTEQTREIILSEGRLFLVRGNEQGTFLTAANPATGAVLWNRQQPVTTLTLAADKSQVVLLDGTKVVALNPDTGATLWSSPVLPAKSRANWLTKNPPRLILQEDAIIIALHKSVYALCARSGQRLWEALQPRSGYASPKDLFVIDGLVWFGDTAGAKNTGRFEGRDLLTGEIKRSFLPDIEAVWLSHHRCHFSKATCNYLLTARMGVEFVDLKREAWTANHWVRGGCIYGVMPCNGLLYAPPHACACYFETKLNGFSALTSNSRRDAPLANEKRLVKGPAYVEIQNSEFKIQNSEDWPTFRRDPARSGSTGACVPTKLAVRWQLPVGEQLTQPVMEGGRLFVSAKEDCTVHALSADDGKPLWTFVAGSRIDSPPTIHRGLVLFGSRDGWIYCLRATDGTLVWQYRAFPHESLIMAYGRLESAWPVSGSVLIEKDELHCVAGRNMFLDGGLRYLRLDPVTGRIISEKLMDQTDPLRGGSIQKYDSWLDMTTTLPDVLSSDGESIYMRSLPFDLQGNRRRVTHIASDSEPPHLFSPNGFLEDTWFHRSYWTYARIFPGGWIGHLNAGRYNPSGRLLVVDGKQVFGFGRKPQYYKWTTSLEYRLFGVDREAHQTRDIFAYDFFKAAQQENFPEMKIDKQMGLPSGPRPKQIIGYPTLWENSDPPVLVTAMVATKDTLFVAGPDDISDEEVLDSRNAKAGVPGKQNDLAKQASAWSDDSESTLLAISKRDGRPLSRFRLSALPVFDGMIATDKHLYIATRKGTLICLGESGD